MVTHYKNYCKYFLQIKITLFTAITLFLYYLIPLLQPCDIHKQLNLEHFLIPIIHKQKIPMASGNGSNKYSNKKIQNLTSLQLQDENNVNKKLKINKIPSYATDSEKDSEYNYKHLQLPFLFTDIMQLCGYSMHTQLAEATKISIKKENMIGDKIEQFLKNNLYKGKIITNTKTAKYLQHLGAFLAKKVKRKGVNYKFFLINDNNFNAMAYPGGKIYINTGLLKYISNEAELAAIIAHEIKHVDLRHSLALYQIAMKIQGTDNPSDFIIFLESLAMHPYSGKIEADADKRGLELAFSCGYSPYQIVEFWRKRANITKDTPSSEKTDNPFIFLMHQADKEIKNVINTHPNDRKRYILLQNHTIALNKIYKIRKFYIGRWNFQNKTPMFKHIK